LKVLFLLAYEKATLILFIKEDYRRELWLLRCINGFPTADKLDTALTEEAASMCILKENVTQCKQNSSHLEDLRFLRKIFLSSSFFFLPIIFREFFFFLQEMFFDVSHLNSVSQATQTTRIAANMLLTTASKVISLGSDTNFLTPPSICSVSQS